MLLAEIARILELDPKTAAHRLNREVAHGYASDLLSDVMAHAQEGDVWVTLQRHPNIVAVAVMKNLAAILLVNGREPEEDTVSKANAEEIPLLVSRLKAFELIGRLHALGISGA